MEKRGLGLLGLLVILALVLGACAQTPTQVTAPENTEPVAPVVEEPTTPVEAPTEAPAPTEATVAQTDINIVHYFSGDLGKEYMTKIIDGFNAAHPEFKVIDNTTGHEDFKTQILVMLAGDNPPDLFSYWAGARTQFVVDAGRLMPLDDWWAANKMDDAIPANLKPMATYGGSIYNIPMNAHIVAMFYNPKVMEAAGITEMPATWEDFLAACEKIKASGVAPIALGSKNMWPAQYWFDYMISRTAGPEYRTKLMAGEAAYTDPEVATAMDYWKTLIDKGYFAENSNGYDWTDAADQVAKGDAAMTLMGTWITGYWDTNGLVAGTDYDFFPFPVIDPELPVVVHGSIDGWTVPADTKNQAGVEALLTAMLDPENQAVWAKGQGALAANKNIDPSIYNVVMKKAADYLGQVQFLSGYDLSTTPPMADGGLNMFAQFMNDPSQVESYLQQVETVAKEVFGK
ncbi:MAG TPA: extracellular solute-binding protein [Anaerolineaceae bacterium]|nr:extracellular solute-binding protein [Anaerolineaceae bacterium]